MRAVILFMLGALSASGQTLIDTDFAKTDHPAGAAEKNPRVSGELPPGWSDNSGWAKVWVDYARGEDEGRAYLNVNVTKVEDGKVQMMHLLPNLEAEAYYRVSLLARSPTRAAVQIGIRDAGPPYQFVWQETPGLAESWKEVTHDFRLGKHAGPVRFFVNVEGTGQVHLAKLKVERRTKEELVAELKSRQPADGPKNLLRQTTFPLGLPCGWSLSREVSDGDEWTLRSEGDAIQISSRKGFDLNSAPLERPVPLQKYVASFTLKTTASGKVAVLADGRTIAQKSFKSAGEDQPVRLEFEAALLARAHVLHFKTDGPGEFSIRELQVVPKGEEEHAQSPGRTWVALGVESPARVHFEDETSTVQVRIGAPAKGSVLKSKVTHVSGLSKPLPDVRLDQPPTTLDYNIFPEAPLGSFRLEAWVESDGQKLSPVSEIVVHRLRRPRYWGKDAPDSPFGVHTLSTTRHNLMAKAIGINWVRLHDAGTKYIGWRYLEPEKGKWVFDDAPIDRYRNAHLKVMGCFSTAPDWATHIDKHRNGYFDQFWRPKSMEEFANYVRVASQHYKGIIDTWDVWNEPWNHEWWAVRYDEEKGKKDVRSGYITSEQPEADFARMVDVCAKTAREVDPKIRVLGINSYAGGQGGKWTSGIVAADGLKLPDVYCYHQYTGQSNLFPGDSVERGFKMAMGPVGKIDKPVWMTEGSSVRDKIGSGLYLHTYPAGAGKEDVLSTSDNLCRFVTSLLANGASKIFLYSMHSHRTFGDGSEWRVLVTEEGYLHPSAAAFSNLAWHLEDTTFIKRIELSPKLNAYLFDSRDRTRSVAVLAPVPGSGAQALPAIDAPFEDLFGNPIKDRKKPASTLVYLPLPGTSQDLEKVLMAR